MPAKSRQPTTCTYYRRVLTDQDERRRTFCVIN